MATIFDKIQPDPNASYKWYQDQVRKLTNVRAQTERLMKSSGLLINKPLPGGMYLFFYDAKHKDTLPYWDQFPLVLPYRIQPNGFYGLNLHYLPYMLRFRILGKLHEYASNDNNDISTRVRLSWKLLSGVAVLQPLQACVKHYLFDHVQSRFLTIAYPDWTTASQLPVESFVGANKQTVWRETRKKY